MPEMISVSIRSPTITASEEWRPSSRRPGAHHQRIGLAAEVGLRPRGHLDGRHQRPAGGGDAIFNGAGQIGVCADELCPLHHQIGGLGQGIQGIRLALAHDHIVRVHIVHGDPGIIQGIEQPRFANGVHRAARCLLLQESSRGQGAGVKMLLRHIQPHASQLLLKFSGGGAAVVGQKQKFLLLPVEPVDELRNPGQDTVAVVDHAIHIADKTFLLFKLNHTRSLLSYQTFFYIFIILPLSGEEQQFLVSCL